MAQRKPSLGTLIKKIKDAPDTAITFVQDLTDKITVSKVGLTLLFGILATIIALGYETRDTLFDKALTMIRGQSEVKNWDVGDETKAQMIGMVRSSAYINYLMITQVDLQQNRRVPKFWYLDSPNEPQIRARAEIMLPQAVFDTDPKNTQQMISILNNEFVCSRYDETIFFKLFPILQKEMPVVCRLSIPPFYGRFTGILTIGLRTTPTTEELERLRIEMARFSVEVYLRDVVKKPDPLLAPGHN